MRLRLLTLILYIATIVGIMSVPVLVLNGQELLFELAYDKLEPLGRGGLCFRILDSEGLAVIPIKNFQGVCVKLDQRMQTGTVSRCMLLDIVDVNVKPNNKVYECAMLCGTRIWDMLEQHDK